MSMLNFPHFFFAGGGGVCFFILPVLFIKIFNRKVLNYIEKNSIMNFHVLSPSFNNNILPSLFHLSPSTLVDSGEII